DQTNVKDPTVSPLQASVEQLKGLPPALVINGEKDVLCDEGQSLRFKATRGRCSCCCSSISGDYS
ncbi:MAG: alpha/beta hydrolase fold domain-containing protein, partial [Nitrososphaeraceae archaeon]